MNHEINYRITYKKQVLTILSGILMVLALVIPVNSDGQGQNEEVTIIAPYQPKITDAPKLSFSPDIPYQENASETYEFNFIDKKVEPGIAPSPIEPLRTGESRQKDLHRNYVKAGFGNYTTPYAELFAGSLQARKYLLSARLKHLSSSGGIKDAGPSGYSHNLISLGAKRIFDKQTLSATAVYQRDVVHFYGYNPADFPEMSINKDDIKQRFNNAEINAGWTSNHDKGDTWSHEISLGAHYFNDLYGTKETGFYAQADIGYDMAARKKDKTSVIGAQIGFSQVSISDTLGEFKPYVLSMKPYLKFRFSQYDIMAGLDVSLDRDSASRLNVFPDLRAQVRMLNDMMKIYAGIRGKRYLAGFRDLAMQNPYVTSIPEYRNMTNQFEFYAGIKARAGLVSLEAEVRDAFYKDMPLFVNDTSSLLENRFSVLYDDVNLMAISGGIGLEDYQGFSAGIHGTYYHYSAKNELRAWHKPSYEARLNLGYTFREKFSARLAAVAVGSRYARGFQPDKQIEIIKLDGAFDLNLGLEYRHNRNWSAFIQLNNILNQKYQLWNQYPVQGFFVLLGVSYSF